MENVFSITAAFSFKKIWLYGTQAGPNFLLLIFALEICLLLSETLLWFTPRNYPEFIKNNNWYYEVNNGGKIRAEDPWKITFSL